MRNYLYWYRILDQVIYVYVQVYYYTGTGKKESESESKRAQTQTQTTLRTIQLVFYNTWYVGTSTFYESSIFFLTQDHNQLRAAPAPAPHLCPAPRALRSSAMAASSLAVQLQVVAATQPREERLKGKASLLYETKDAADIDLATIYAVGLQGERHARA